MKPSCRIGKVTLKNGTKILPFKHFAIVRNPSSFVSLDYANMLAKDGRINAIAITLIADGGYVHNKVDKPEAIWTSSMIGAIDSLRYDVMKEWNS